MNYFVPLYRISKKDYMDFKDLVQLRRSHRKFTDEEIDADDVKMILRAGLMAPTSKGQRAWHFVVVDDKGASKEYKGKTDTQFLKGLMDELKAKGDFTYEGTDGEYGLYIDSVNGLKADYNVDKAYWAIYVNGEYGQLGADTQPVNDGDSFKLAYEK